MRTAADARHRAAMRNAHANTRTRAATNFPAAPQANTARRNAKSCAAFITQIFPSLTAAPKPTAAL